MDAKALLTAAQTYPHSHRGLSHGQESNPFHPWSAACRFRCFTCLFIMAHDGTDIALAFTQQLPWKIDRRMRNDEEATWWKETYLYTLKWVEDAADREWMREQLAGALRRGKEDAKSNTG